jgi:hypothetical protein
LITKTRKDESTKEGLEGKQESRKEFLIGFDIKLFAVEIEQKTRQTAD